MSIRVIEEKPALVQGFPVSCKAIERKDAASLA